MPRFRKRPVEIDAVHWTGDNRGEMRTFLNEGRVGGILDLSPEDPNYLRISTLEGVMTASPGDWIIRGVRGEFYPCRADIFEATYESMDETRQVVDPTRLCHSRED